MRIKLWQLDHVYHCTVIGTCLTLEEIKKLLHSLNVDCHNYKPYDIHTHVVTVMGSNNVCSKKIQRYLDKKFSSIIKKTLKMTANKLEEEWINVFETVDLIGTFWALISHPNTTDKMRKIFYGDIHMLSHTSKLTQQINLKPLGQLESFELQQTQIINAQKQQIKQLKQDLKRLKTEMLV
ncbi:MAG: hypothetical protein KAG06_03370 [Methylococcales bacterium]|nr:hypothetical protein [Methylococcales bacterium]